MRTSALLSVFLMLQAVVTTRSKEEPWVEILSPSPAQLFVEGKFASIQLHFRVHGQEMGVGKGVANVYVIRQAMSYGGDAFRGREGQRATPDARVHESEARISLDSLQLELGLHQVRVHLICEDAGTEREVAESAAFFEIRLPTLPPEEEEADPDAGSLRVSDEILANAYDERIWFDEEEGDQDDLTVQSIQESVDSMWRDYVKLHAHMLKPSTPASERRLLILDQTAGGLGNRLGSVISGLLLAMLADRALLVFWDLGGYLVNGDPGAGGLRWQFSSLDDIRIELGPEAVQGTEYTDMGELAPFLACARYSSPPDTAAAEDAGAAASSDLAYVPTLRIRNPHYYVPLIVSNPHYRRRLLATLGTQPARRLMRKLFVLAPYLQAKVDAVKLRFAGRAMIGLQIRQARWCGRATLPDDSGSRTATNAYMTAQHHTLFYACALSLLREYKGRAGFYLATDLPDRIRPEAATALGAARIVYAQLPDNNVHDSRAAMEEGRPADFDGAFMDLWLLASCDELVTTPASSFGYIASALAGVAPVTVTKWGKCLRPLSSEPLSHAWPLLEHLPVPCFDKRMLVPEYDMMCQDCVVLQCPCGDLTCASHSEPPHPLFPRQVAQVPG